MLKINYIQWATIVSLSAGNKGSSSLIQPLLALAPKSVKSREIPRELGGFSRSRSSKFIHIGVNRKSLCDFLVVINSNFGCISYRFRDIAVYSQTRSQAVARIADLTASQQTIVCRIQQLNSNGKSKPLTKFEVTSSDSFEDMLGRMPVIVGSRNLGQAHFQGKLFVYTLGITRTKSYTKFEVSWRYWRRNG